MQHKTFEAKAVNRSENGGRIIISTSSLDRDNDRVFATGARVERYNANPVVQWQHSYSEPWNTVGKTTKLTVEADRLIADFELRKPVNQHDPQNIVRQLWAEGLIKSASVGFIPLRSEQNSAGGRDHYEWELLEWSLVVIGAQPDAQAMGLRRHRRSTSDTRAQAVKGMELCVEVIQHPDFRRATEQKQAELLLNWVTLAEIALG